MGATLEKAPQTPPTRDDIMAAFAAEGLRPYDWANAPDDTYAWHAHGYRKILYCVSGSIVFHTRDGDFALEPGDRLEVEPGTEHAATVGPDGVRCMEAAG